MMSLRQFIKGSVSIGLLWLVFYLLGDKRLIPNPASTVVTTFRLLLTGELLGHLMFSGIRLLVAIAIALIIGVSLGMAMGLSVRIRNILEPMVYFLFPVPKAAFLPLIFVFFGIGDLSKIILIALILVFQMIVSVYDATKSLDQNYFLVAKSLHLSKPLLYRKVIFPGILSSVFSALKISVGIGIAVLFFAETYATDKGLGYFIMNAWFVLDYERMISGIIMMGFLGYLLFSLIEIAMKKWLPWQYAGGQHENTH